MLRISLIAIGTLQNPWKTLAAEYIKRVSPFAKLTVKEQAAIPFRTTSDKTRILTNEGNALLRGLPHGAHIVALTEHGKEMNSMQFANFLQTHDDSGQEIVFLIGGPLGISPDVVAHADRTLALSKLTFTHECARVLLLEQIYRAATIIKGKTYHY
jgi:23S rRNA (pseudouridine1915-N3)-methyltransferase